MKRVKSSHRYEPFDGNDGHRCVCGLAKTFCNLFEVRRKERTLYRRSLEALKAARAELRWRG